MRSAFLPSEPPAAASSSFSSSSLKWVVGVMSLFSAVSLVSFRSNLFSSLKNGCYSTSSSVCLSEVGTFTSKLNVQGAQSGHVTGKEMVSDSVTYVTETARRALEEEIKNSSEEMPKAFLKAGDNSKNFPYFAFMPIILGTAVPDGDAFPFSVPGDVMEPGSQCYSSGEMKAVKEKDGSVRLSVSLSNGGKKPSRGCAEHYVIMTAEGISIHRVAVSLLFPSEKAEMKVHWKPSKRSTEAGQKDLHERGLRVFKVRQTLTNSLKSILKTAAMFTAELSRHVPKIADRTSDEFLKKYRGLDMKRLDKRITVEEAIAREKDMKPGDMLGILRMDGLDPMLAYGMGANTGHTVVLVSMQKEGDDRPRIYVTESTAKDSYWPVNGIQATRYDEWIRMADKADMNVFHLPLDESNGVKAQEGNQAMIEYFKTVEGVDYGYRNMLYSWLDTEADNLPCLPPDFKVCLRWPHLELLLSALSFFSPDTASMIFLDGLQKRLQMPESSHATFAEILNEARRQNIDPAKLPAIPERDEWRYNTTRFGKPAYAPQRVCCAFVCSMWKAGGLFDDSMGGRAEAEEKVECAEMTNRDVVDLNIFERDGDGKTIHPQILGYRAIEPDETVNSVTPYPHMFETCPGAPPDYARPDQC